MKVLLASLTGSGKDSTQMPTEYGYCPIRSYTNGICLRTSKTACHKLESIPPVQVQTFNHTAEPIAAL